MNENIHTTYPNLWDIMKKEVRRSKVIALSEYIKKNMQRSHTTNLTAHMNALYKKKNSKPQGIEGKKSIK